MPKAAAAAPTGVTWYDVDVPWPDAGQQAAFAAYRERYGQPPLPGAPGHTLSGKLSKQKTSCWLFCKECDRYCQVPVWVSGTWGPDWVELPVCPHK